MLKLILITIHLMISLSLKITIHPLENKICYIYGIKNINKIDTHTLSHLKNIFKKHPLLIFKDIDPVSPKEFINFLTNFDPDHDIDAINNPDKYPNQMLQPFDQFPDCKHVAPRGNIELHNFYDIKNIKVKPSDSFINNYLWHVDLLGHEYKLPNVITGFYIIESPLIGGETDFISAEKIYENLDEQEKEACNNMLIEINRKKFIMKDKILDYSGSSRLENYEEYNEGQTFIPLVYAPEDNYEKPKILILPSFFEKVVGWDIEESREWIKNFMYNHVLPHRISIQWKKGDLALFNNRRFIHSSTPARNYLDFKDKPNRLLLQTFLPTNKPLLGIKPYNNNPYSAYNIKWINNKNKALQSSNEYLNFVISNSGGSTNDKYYIICSKKN